MRTFPRRPEDGRIDWFRSSEEIYRLVRASSKPFSGAYSTLEGNRKVILWRAEPYQCPCQFLAVPGQVCLQVDGDPVVACGEGMLRLTKIEMEDAQTDVDSKAEILSSLRNRLR